MTKAQSMAKARAIKTQRVKDKIQSAINVLTLYGDVKITIRAISDESGVSKTTVQKYISAKKEQFFDHPTPLKVNFEEKEAVKKLGATWDIDKKAWIAPKGAKKANFSKWL